MYDASARIVTFNQRYIDMFDLSTGHREARLSFPRPDAASQGQRILRRRRRTNSVPPSCETSRVAEVDHSIMQVPGRALLHGRQQAAGAWRLGRHDGRHHRTPPPRAGTRPQLRLPEPDHRSHPLADHREGRARPPLSPGQPRGRDPVRHFARAASSARPPSTSFRKTSAEIITADDDKTLQSADGLFKDEHLWESQAMGPRFITSRRLGNPRFQAGEPRYIINVVDDVTERRRADETDRASRALRRADRPAEPGAVPRTDRARACRRPSAASNSPCSISISTNSRASTIRSDIMSATNC